MKPTRIGALLVLAVTLILSTMASAAPPEPRTMLTGADFAAWQPDTGTWLNAGEAFADPSDEKRLATKPGTGVFVNGPDGKTLHLLTKAEFGDALAHIEFMVPKGSNSGVYFQGRYEIQVFDSWGVEKPTYTDCGGIYQRWDEKREPKGYEGHGPRLNAALPPGQWQTYDVVFRAPRFDGKGNKTANASFLCVMHNGKVIHENVELTGPTRASAYEDEKPAGPLMIQGDHGPVAYRNIWIQPIHLSEGNAMAGLDNAFFAMDTGTKDEAHQTASDQARMLKELGYAGIGSSGFANLSEMLAAVDANGLKLFTIYISANIEPDTFSYEEGLKEACRLLKGRDTVLWINIGSKTLKPSSTEGDAACVRMLREMADIAAEDGVRLALYPHTWLWLETVGDAVRIVKQVDRKNVGVTFNLCHWLNAEKGRDMEGVLKNALPYLFVVSINGADHEGGWDRLIQTLDRGAFDVCGFLATLKTMGYIGPIGLQGYGIKGDVRVNLEHSMAAWHCLNVALGKRD